MKSKTPITSLSTKLIANEFALSPNLVNYKVEHNTLHNQFILNKAEVIAQREEQIRLEQEEIKKRQIEERNKKIKENLINYNKIAKQEKEVLAKKTEFEKKSKKDKINNYNESIREKIVKKNNKADKSINLAAASMTFTDNISKENINGKNDFETFSFNENVKEEVEMEKEPIPMENKKTVQNNNMSNSVVNIREEMDKLILEEITSGNKNNLKQQNKNKVDTDINVKNVIKQNLESIKCFRKNGVVNNNLIQKEERNATQNINNNTEDNMKQLNEIEKNKKYFNELEKRRYFLF